MFLYEHEGGGAQKVWTPSDVFERWPPETYLEEDLSFFPSNVAQEIRDRTGKLLIWMEQCGNDLDGRTNIGGQPCEIEVAGRVHRTVLDDGLWEDDTMVTLRLTLSFARVLKQINFTSFHLYHDQAVDRIFAKTSH